MDEPGPAPGFPPRRIEAGGRTVVLRQATPADRDAIVACHLALDPDARLTRFHSMVADRMMVEFVEASLRRGDLTVVAEDEREGRLLGMAECQAPDAQGRADLGIVVAGEARGTGLGHALLDALADLARSRGVQTLTADVLTGNRAMLGLLRSWGCAVADGRDPTCVRLWVGTDRRMPAWPERQDGERRLLVEAAAWPGHEVDAALRAEGVTVALCRGPARSHHPCDLLDGGRCALAEGADAVLLDLPEGEVPGLTAAHASAGHLVVRRPGADGPADALRDALRHGDAPPT